MTTKPVLIAPRSQAREIDPDSPDFRRYLDSGSWVLVVIPKKLTPLAKRQRKFKRKREAAGYKKLEVLLPPHVVEAVYAKRLNGETMAELIKRVFGLSDDSEEISQQQTQRVDSPRGT